MTHTSAEQERAEPIKMQPGDDLHLTMLMAPHGLNFVTGKDREQLLAWGRDVWQAARRAPVVPVETLETEYASCLAQCRDAFPVPDVNTELEGLWVAAMGCPLSVPEYIKAIAAAPQPPEAGHIDQPLEMVADQAAKEKP